MTQVRINRLETIIEVLLNCGGEVGCTRTEIAAQLFKPDGTPLKMSPYITALVKQLVADGFAIETLDTSGWPHALRYSPSEALLKMRRDNAAA